MNENQIKVYREEASELLVTLEQALLELEERPDDKELINQVFRALHTIKGSGGMFGFDNIAEFTHVVETVYDAIRNGDLEVSKDIIDLTLAAKDQITAMLIETPENKISDDKAIEEISAGFNKINENLDTKAYVPSSPIKQTPATDEKASPPPSGSPVSYYIYFKPEKGLLLNGTNPLLLIDELDSLGLLIRQADLSNIPALEELEPESCYVAWDFILTTDEGLNAVKDIFIFVEDDAEITIEVIDKTGSIDRSLEKEVLEIINKREPDYIEQLKNLGRDTKPQKKSVEKRGSDDNIQSAIKRAGREMVTSIRVDSEKLDSLVNLVGELVIVQARLSQTASDRDFTDIEAISEQVERLTWELRETALNLRMLPIGTTFSKFKRLVRDLSSELGKNVELETYGGDTELDKTVIDNLNDPLVHIIRNSIDHGIESPEERKASGKPETGTVKLKAQHAGTNVLIRISDDGAGLNKDAIYQKALKQGLISERDKLTDEEIYQLIFQPGFSTAAKVTNVSGRGVGMDVVKRSIDNLRGSVKIESTPGKGSEVVLVLPLTLAIIEGLLVRVGTDFFIIPHSLVDECLEITKTQIDSSKGKRLYKNRDEMLPYVMLRERFEENGDVPQIQQIVTVQDGESRIGVVVDEVIGQHQTVIKSLGKLAGNVEEISGATILGDGTVALIIDVFKLIQNAQLAEAEEIKKSR